VACTKHALEELTRQIQTRIETWLDQGHGELPAEECDAGGSLNLRDATFR
jgi:hypothetical protein